MEVLKFRYMDTEKTGLAALGEGVSFGKNANQAVVRTERGLELVKALKLYSVSEETLEKFGASKDELYSLVREATEEDRRKFNENLLFCEDALKVCREKIEKHGLEMKLVKAYTTLNRERIVFYFTAKSRVDFRQLVRDLASHFRTRIELRQIGVRDEVKMLGALGMCGRVCCCKDFIDCFQSISLNLAKLQGLPPNPAKLSGSCGRLMCCLKFEELNYLICEHLPPVGEKIETPQGRGRVVDVNVVLERITVDLEEGRRVDFDIRELVPKEVWEDYIERLKEKKDDRFSCFSKAGVIGDETSQKAGEPA